jgi:drug/metabolite transporter (DMT)-like permease
VASVRGEWSGLAFSVRSATAFIYLTTIGAIGGFVAYTYALRHLPVSLVSLYAYINPIIAVALGVLLLGEPFDIRMALAAALVFAGVGIVQSRSARTLRLARTPPGASSLGRQTNARASVQKRAV